MGVAGRDERRLAARVRCYIPWISRHDALGQGRGLARGCEFRRDRRRLVGRRLRIRSNLGCRRCRCALRCGIDKGLGLKGRRGVGDISTRSGAHRLPAEGLTERLAIEWLDCHCVVSSTSGPEATEHAGALFCGLRRYFIGREDRGEAGRRRARQGAQLLIRCALLNTNDRVGVARRFRPAITPTPASGEARRCHALRVLSKLYLNALGGRRRVGSDERRYLIRHRCGLTHGHACRQ